MGRKVLAAVIAVVMVIGTGCTWTNTAAITGGVTTFDGKSATHVNVTKIGVNLLFTEPLVGDASLQGTMDDVVAEAKKAGADKIRIVQSKKTTLWFVFIPFSLVVHPVISNVAADAIK